MNILFLLFFMLAPAQAVILHNPIDKIAQLIKNADTEQICSMLDESVTLTILGEENVYFKGQADVIIDKFFKNHTPTAVKTVHKVESNANYLYAVYETKTSNGNFRISVQMRSNGSDFLISEFKVEANKF